MTSSVAQPFRRKREQGPAPTPGITRTSARRKYVVKVHWVHHPRTMQSYAESTLPRRTINSRPIGQSENSRVPPPATEAPPDVHTTLIVQGTANKEASAGDSSTTTTRRWYRGEGEQVGPAEVVLGRERRFCGRKVGVGFCFVIPVAVRVVVLRAHTPQWEMETQPQTGIA